MNTQSIIVYQNPLEQQMWEGLMSGNAFPIIVGVAVFLITYALANKFIIDKFFGHYYSMKGNIAAYVAMAVSAIAGGLTIRFMML